MSNTVINYHNDVKYCYFLNIYELISNLPITHSKELFNHYDKVFLFLFLIIKALYK